MFRSCQVSKIRGERTGRVGDSDARLLVHQSQIGCIIGRGGAKVKELREVIIKSAKTISRVAPTKKRGAPQTRRADVPARPPGGVFACENVALFSPLGVRGSS